MRKEDGREREREREKEEEGKRGRENETKTKIGTETRCKYYLQPFKMKIKYIVPSISFVQL